jgi:hypothetical protein
VLRVLLQGPLRAWKVAEFFPGTAADRERLQQTVATVGRFLSGEQRG